MTWVSLTSKASATTTTTRLTTLCTALAAPAPAAAPDPQLNYVSKYPEHPINMGYGTDYPKYWQNENYNPADYPAPVMQPRVPFYPYPYSTAWKSAGPPTEPNEIEVKVVPEAPAYEPPHGFPNSKSPARDAINAYSGQLQYQQQDVEAASAGGARAKAPQQQPMYPPSNDPSLMRHQDPRYTTKNMKFSNDPAEQGVDGGYTKVINNPYRGGSQDAVVDALRASVDADPHGID